MRRGLVDRDDGCRCTLLHDRASRSKRGLARSGRRERRLRRWRCCRGSNHGRSRARHELHRQRAGWSPLGGVRREMSRVLQHDPQGAEVDEQRQDDRDPDDRNRHDVVTSWRFGRPVHRQPDRRLDGARTRGEVRRDRRIGLVRIRAVGFRVSPLHREERSSPRCGVCECVNAGAGSSGSTGSPACNNASAAAGSSAK